MFNFQNLFVSGCRHVNLDFDIYIYIFIFHFHSLLVEKSYLELETLF